MGKPLEVRIGSFFTFSFFHFCLGFFLATYIYILSSMKTAICLVVCCFLLNFRFELGNATKTLYAKLKRASFNGKANEHIGRNKRCSKFWGGCKTSDDCCGPVLNCAYQWGTSFCNLSGRWEMIFCVKTKSVWSKTEN